MKINDESAARALPRPLELALGALLLAIPHARCHLDAQRPFHAGWSAALRLEENSFSHPKTWLRSLSLSRAIYK